MAVKKCMSAGEFRRRIIIQTPTRTSDSMGGGTTAWSTFKTVWAKIEPVSASQVFYSQQLEHRVTHKISTRYFSGLTSDMRVKYGTRIFHIQSYRNLEERNRYYEIMAEEGKAS